MTTSLRKRCWRLLLPLVALSSLAANVSLYFLHRRFMNMLEDALKKVQGEDRHAGMTRKASRFSEATEKRPLAENKRKKAMVQQVPNIEQTASALAPNATFGACILIKDDNEILSEWIAYHYHTLTMRRLIVAVDPLSAELPSNILRKWTTLTDLRTLRWDDQHYMPADFLKSGRPPAEYMQNQSGFSRPMAPEELLEISNHRYRQRVFLAQCMRKLRDKGSSWVIHIDSDEYATTSKLLREVQPPGLTIPPIEQPGSLLNVLQQVVRQSPSEVRYPCISVLRVLFGALESSPEDIEANVPERFDPAGFETLRWRYHGPPANLSLHGSPKVILDVSAIPTKYFPKDLVYSIHRPVEEYCARNKDLNYSRYKQLPITANHYLGSWERYSARPDKRRTRETFEAKAYWQQEMDDYVRPWLKGFISNMGEDLVSQLLGKAYLAGGAQ